MEVQKVIVLYLAALLVRVRIAGSAAFGKTL